MPKPNHRKGRLALLLVLVICATLPALATIEIVRLNVAPLLGPCWSVEDLMRAANRNPGLVREAVRQANHGPAVAEAVLQALCAGQVTEQTLPKGEIMQTMSWYGTNRLGREGVWTLRDAQLELEGGTPCWILQVPTGSKVILWAVPKACGNVGRWKLGIIPPKPAPQPSIQAEATPSPAQIGFAFAPERERVKIDKGQELALGSTQSGVGVQFAFRPPETNVVQNGGGANVRVANDLNNIGNPVIQNNNSAIGQGLAVVPVNVVVNTGPGGASGSATGSGNQGAGSGQGNGNIED